MAQGSHERLDRIAGTGALDRVLRLFGPFEDLASRAVVEKVAEGQTRHVPLRPIAVAAGVAESKLLDAMITRKRCVAGDGKENSFASPSQAIDMPFQPNCVPCIVGSS